MAVEIKRTLLKSRPELWAEVSDQGALARRMGPFDSIRITRVEPESVVDWEGGRAVGSVRLEPSGFGTRVTLTARLREEAEVVQAAIPAPPSHDPARGFWTRLLRRPTATATASEPAEAPSPAGPTDADGLRSILVETMDALGTAHHRPFSRV